MMRVSNDERIIYIDESGDLGFGPGGSRHFVIAAVSVEPSSSHLLKRYVRSFKRSISISAAVELKASGTQHRFRSEFYRGLVRVPCAIHYIVVDKRNVRTELRQDTNILYNYATGLLLAPLMQSLQRAVVNVDCRTIKVASGNSLHDYLRIKLWYEMNSPVNVIFAYIDSRNCLGVQAADMVSNAVLRKYERNDGSDLMQLEKLVRDGRKLFFASGTKKKRLPAGG